MSFIDSASGIYSLVLIPQGISLSVFYFSNSIKNRPSLTFSMGVEYEEYLVGFMLERSYRTRLCSLEDVRKIVDSDQSDVREVYRLTLSDGGKLLFDHVSLDSLLPSD